ncbi:MAG TPA: hypothetical protein VMV86_01820 [Methanosarcinales archaeon]|nr:hypothetical protein [Methanosarcinales archaeon]
MLERLKNLKSTAAGIASAIISICLIFGLDLSGYSEFLIGILGLIGTLVGLFSKDK